MTPAPSPHEPGVSINAEGKKVFIPLENNPEVFTELAHQLGVSRALRFYDVLSIDEPELLALVPRPVHALIFISPADVYHRVRRHDGPEGPIFEETEGETPPVMWFKQTIGNACGTMALVHSVCNGPAREFIAPNSTLDKLLQQAVPLKARDRAALLYNSSELEKAHMSMAVKGDSVAPSSEDGNGYHFISFVKGNDGHLYELEGSWNRPIDRGSLNDADDCLREQALQMGVKKFVEAAEGNVEFSIIALAGVPNSPAS